MGCGVSLVVTANKISPDFKDYWVFPWCYLAAMMMSLVSLPLHFVAPEFIEWIYRTALTGLWGGFYCISRLVTNAHATLHFQTFRTMAWTQVHQESQPQDSSNPFGLSYAQRSPDRDDIRRWTTQDRGHSTSSTSRNPILSRKAALRHSRPFGRFEIRSYQRPNTTERPAPKTNTLQLLATGSLKINTTMISTKLWKFMIQLPSIANGSLTLLQY